MSEDLLSVILFVIVFLVAPLIDGVARKRRKARTTAQIPTPTPQPEEFEYEHEDDRGDGWSGAGTLEPYHTPSSGESDRSGSEGLLPTDLWEEIAGLSRGDLPQLPDPEPRQPSRRADELEEYHPPAPVAARERHTPLPASRMSPRIPPGSNPTAKRRGRSRPPVGEKRSTRSHLGAADVRRLLQGAGGRESLRRAVIFSEILGPPKSMQDGLPGLEER